MALLAAVFLAGGCLREEKAAVEESEIAAPVKEAIYRICRLERTSPSEHSAKVIDVKGMTARDFRRVLTEFPGRDVHVWMPGESRWLLVGNLSTNAVSLARALEAAGFELADAPAMEHWVEQAINRDVILARRPLRKEN